MKLTAAAAAVLMVAMVVGVCRAGPISVADGGGGLYPPVDTTNLEQLFVIMRHGVRAPWSTYPLDPHKDDTSRWPLGRSQLTAAGVAQATNIGQLIAERYRGLAEKLMTRKQILLRSSAAQRCFDTVQLAMRKIWSVNTDNQLDPMKMPVVYSLPKRVDSVLYEEPECQLGDEEERNNLNQPEALAYLGRDDIKSLSAYVSNATGLPGDWSGLNKAFDCVRCEKLNNFEMAAWAQVNHTYDRLAQFYTDYFNFLYSSTKSQRLRAGPLLADVLGKIDSFDAGDNETRRLFMYTTHDYKISALIKALGSQLKKYPAFASTVLVEVYNVPGVEKSIRIFHVDQTITLPYDIEELPLANCRTANDQVCKLSTWRKSLEPLLNVDWNQECGLHCGQFDFNDVAEDSLGDS